VTEPGESAYGSDAAASTAAHGTGATATMTVDDLARRAQLPVRTIREYHTMRLLPPPERRGRVGIYGPGHVQRLNLIGRLQRRGYSLAGIRDLLQAWDAGTGLTAVLGVDADPGALDETPLRLSAAELASRFPALAGERLEDVCAAGLIQPGGDGFGVRSPALLALVTDGAEDGIPFEDMLELAATLRRHVAALAPALADVIADRLILPLLAAGRKPDELAPLLQRGRLLLIQAAASMLTDQLGAALLASAARGERAADGSGEALRAVVEQIRIGAVADAAGSIRHAAREQHAGR
jgi:DNA-binding transcriptional MerR regulator